MKALRFGLGARPVRQGASAPHFVLGQGEAAPPRRYRKTCRKDGQAAIDELRNAVQSLEIAIDGRFDKEKDVSEFDRRGQAGQ